MDPDRLRHWSQILAWLSVCLPVLGGFAALARFYVDRRTSTIASARQAGEVDRAKREAATAHAASDRLTDEQEILRRDLDQAREQAKEASARSETLRRAAEPRRLTPAQLSRLTQAFSKCVPTDVRINVPVGSMEAMGLALQLQEAFRAAGISVGTTECTFFGGIPRGIFIDVGTDAPNPCALSTKEAFRASGVEVGLTHTPGLQQGGLTITVGHKPE